MTGRPLSKDDDTLLTSRARVCDCCHSLSTCQFLKCFPEVSYPKLHFYARSQTPLRYVEELSGNYTQPVACLFYITQQVSDTRCSILASVDSNANKGTLKRYIPQDADKQEASDSSEEETYQFVPPAPKKPATSDLKRANRTVLMINGDRKLTNQDFLMSCINSGIVNLVMPCLALSSTVVLVNKTEDYFCLALITKDHTSAPCYSVVFDAKFQRVFPVDEIFNDNLSNILKISHLALKDLRSLPDGCTVFLYTPDLKLLANDLSFGTKPNVLEFLTQSCFQGPNKIAYTLQNQPVTQLFHFDCIRSFTKYKSRDVDLYVSSAPKAALLVYHRNLLIYFKVGSAAMIGRKRKREETHLRIVVVRAKRNFVNRLNQLNWNEALYDFFAAISEGDYSGLSVEIERA
mmetsp:Transcript_11404/g.22383  ORF Transcript_11404/g.22383 Transcript_11404/m.22383 type:complete len:404 (-) Transcript_11404:303-1514(-)